MAFVETIWTFLHPSLRHFSRAREGNVAITFAIATLPLIGAVGAAVDYSHANSVKTAMQNALDSTALMLSRDAPNLSNSDLQIKALAYFTAWFWFQLIGGIRSVSSPEWRPPFEKA